MTNYIDLIFCKRFSGEKVLAYAPMNEFIKKGDIVRISEMAGYFIVKCTVTVSKDSEVYNFIIEALGEPNKVTDRYSHKEIEDSEDE